MSALPSLLESLPEAARDARLNASSVLSGGSLTPGQRWGVAIACAATLRHAALRDAVLADAHAELGEGALAVIDDGNAAASLMAMNNVYYRFRHLIEKEAYTHRPARLRMNRLGKPATSLVDFELYCLAVSAINACATCIQAHERVVLEGGLTEEQVHDAVRIAAVLSAAAVSLTL